MKCVINLREDVPGIRPPTKVTDIDWERNDGWVKVRVADFGGCYLIPVSNIASIEFDEDV